MRESVAVATKFGLRIDESRRTGGGNDVRPEAIRAECEASLRRLGLEAVDLYQLHGGAETVAAAEDVVATCEELLAEGKIRSFGTAQDDAETVAVFRPIGPLRVGADPGERLRLDHGHAGRRARPRVGRVGPDTTGHGHAVRQVRPKTAPSPATSAWMPWWDYFDADTMPGWLHRLDTVRELLTVGGPDPGAGRTRLPVGPRPVDHPVARDPHRAAGAGERLGTGTRGHCLRRRPRR